jgi:flagellar assembly factor FliW
MNSSELTQGQSAPACAHTANDVIRLPYGLLGFERVKNYVLLTNADEAPFMWLQMLEQAKRSFLVVTPSLIVPEYQPELGERDVEFLELTSPGDAFLISIVTLRPHSQATVNLKGPIVINRRTLIGKQVIPNNAAGYSLKHPLPVS